MSCRTRPAKSRSSPSGMRKNAAEHRAAARATFPQRAKKRLHVVVFVLCAALPQRAKQLAPSAPQKNRRALRRDAPNIAPFPGRRKPRRAFKVMRGKATPRKGRFRHPENLRGAAFFLPLKRTAFLGKNSLTI